MVPRSWFLDTIFHCKEAGLLGEKAYFNTDKVQMSQNDFLYLRVRSTQNNAIVFNGKRLKGSVLTTSIQHSIRDFSQGS